MSMRRIVFGLVLIPVLACGSVSAGEAQVPAGSEGTQKAEVLPPSDQPAHSLKSSKRMPKQSLRSAAAPRSLQSAETYAADHSASPPALSGERAASPATSSWTGFYVGAGAGVGHQ
jgi:hypothetical protein